MNLDNQLWVDRYAPKKLEDLVGNQNKVSECMQWLTDWYDIQSGKLNKKAVHKTREKNRPINDPNARAMLLSGPPGIGKTTTVRLLADLLGFDMLEMNASDTRNKSSIESMLQDLSQ